MSEENQSSRRRLGTIAIVLVCFTAIWLRMPYISSGLPYFYDEDEAHHFNRVANMVKSGDYDPHYFRKPSLHFYLRMPVLATSFLWNVKQGHIRSIKELKTKDPYGLADFAFSTSHPGIVKWNRAFSVLLSLGTVILTMLLAYELSASWFASAFAGALVAVSPDLLSYSATVGVDVLMAFMCLATVFYAIKIRVINFWKIFTCGLIAGLAVSSKYNAAPIALVPLAVLVSFRDYSPKLIFTAIASPILGFFIASPYILSSLPLFLDHFGYEIWHYGIAGHEGHTAEPGLNQLYFYLSWLSNSAIGITALLTAFLGLLGFLRGKNPRLVFLVFPALFFLLMISQKANFTRNMLVIVPFFAILSGIFIRKILKIISSERNALFAASAAILFVVPLIQPFAHAIGNVASSNSILESRVSAKKWLDDNQDKFKRIAVAGELQFAPSILSNPKVKIVSEKESSLLDLYLQGYDLAILSDDFFKKVPKDQPYKVEVKYIGAKEAKRIIRNPSFQAVSFAANKDVYKKLSHAEVAKNSKYSVYVNNPSISTLGLKGSPCSNDKQGSVNENEPYCWISSRNAKIEISKIKELGQSIDHNGNITLFIETMSPWADQEVSLSIAGKKGVQFLISEPGKWQSFPLEIPYLLLLEHGSINVSLAKIASPMEAGLSKDSRLLGLAIRSVSAG